MSGDGKSLDEFGIIARHFAPLAGKRGKSIETFSLQDDAALISSAPGKRLVVTSDSLVSGIHFFGHEEPHLIAQKALRSNISDLASKGAKLKGYTLSLHLQAGTTNEWLADFAHGLAMDQKQFSISLLGGDTVSSQTLAIAITAIGEVGARYPARIDAKAGDDIYVTGTLGDAALGLRILDGTLTGIATKAREFLVDRYLLPQPRVEAKTLLSKYAHASMDVSDGLLGDLAKICKASKLAAKVNHMDLPFSKAASAAMIKSSKARDWAFQGGDDYEILFTAAPRHRETLITQFKDLPFAATRIGEIVEKSDSDGVKMSPVRLLDENGEAMDVQPASHSHRF